ncbi:MAG: lamin tail domain-containing protein [Phycisphaerales bacterium]
MQRSVFAFTALAAAVVGLSTSAADAQVRITEFMSEGQGDLLSGNGGRRQREFFEITNLGAVSVDVSGWSYNDNNTNDPINWGPSVGTIGAGESIVFTQMSAADFRSYWGLDNSVRVFTYGQLSNLGNADTINIYNSFTQNASTLVDTLDYLADARGSGVSRNRPYGGTDQSLNGAWVISAAGDSFQSWLAPSPTGFPPNFPTPGAPYNAADYIDLANPGRYVPTPGAACMLGLAGLAATRRRR